MANHMHCKHLQHQMRSTNLRSRHKTSHVSGYVLPTWLLLCLLPTTFSAHVQVTRPMKEHMKRFVSKVPVGKDYMSHMTDPQRIAWSHDLGYNINETLKALRDTKVSITVDVKLVGFAGDGNEALHIGDHELQMYLRTLHNQLDTVALHPSPQHMAVTPEVLFRVMPAYYELAPKVAAAINQAINTGQTSRDFTDYPLHLIPYQNVDSLIQDDFSHGDGSYTIYLLNPPAHAPYAYAYHADDKSANTSCPGSLWVSNKRYAWFDLTANLTFYGPGPGGKGQVFAHSTPILKHYKKEVMHRAILPDLAALIWSACQHLIWPPLHHSALSFNSKLEVHLIYMVEALHRPKAGEGRVDVYALQQQLQAVGEQIGQQVSVLEHFVLFGECDHCVTAYSGALKARTSRSAAQKGSFKLSVSHYLDLPELETWLTEWREVLLSDAGVNWDTEHGGAAILPVFIFDVPSKEPVLLDGLLQAAVLTQGDVVAVRSTAAPFPTFFGCFEHQMHINPRDIHRPVLAAVMQQAYGVADPALSWSRATGKTWSFIWSVGQNPFGTLSSSTTLSFTQTDAALRNVALTYLNNSMHHAAVLIEGFNMLAAPAANGHFKNVKDFLQPDQVIPYNQRISLLLFKIREAAAALAERQHALAVGYAVSTVDDVAALHKITRQYKSLLNPDLVCMGAQEHMRWWVLPGVFGFITLALTVWRCARGSSEAEVEMPHSRRSSGHSSFGGGHHRAY